MSTLSQFGFGERIKSIQRGTIALPSPPNTGSYNGPPLTETATIASVNTLKSILSVLGQQSGITYNRVSPLDAVAGSAVLASLELTNSTTITAKSGFVFGNSQAFAFYRFTYPPTISWQLVEYE